MKTHFAKVFAILFCLTLCVSVSAQKKANDKLKGLWTYSLPDAPYAYQDGTIEFKESEGKLTAVIKIQDSNTITVNEIKNTDNTYTCSLYVDGSDVKVTFIPGDNKITGTVVADGWEMPITLTPKK